MQEESQLFICCPGNEIPSWFSYQSQGSSINIKLSSQWFSTNFLGFTLCAAVAFENYRDCSSLVFQTESEFKTDCGESYKFDLKLWGWVGDEDWDVFRVDRYVNSDHLLFWYDYSLNLNLLKKEDGANWCTTLQKVTEASFHLYPVDLFKTPVDSCCVKKCGVGLMYAQDSSTVMDQDVGEPEVGESSKSKRPRQVPEPSGTVVFSDEGGEEEEEEEEPQPKRI